MYCKHILLHVVLPVHCDTMNPFKIHHFVFFLYIKTICTLWEVRISSQRCLFLFWCSLSVSLCTHMCTCTCTCTHLLKSRLGDGTHSWHLFILCSPEILSTERLWTVVFWDGMSCGLVGNDRHFRSTCCLQLEGKIVFTSTLKRDSARYSETLVSTSQTTLCHKPEDDNIKIN